MNDTAKASDGISGPDGSRGEHDELARLRAENERLAAKIRDVQEADSRPRRPGRWRTVLAVVFIVVGGLLAPAGLVAGWAAGEMTNTDRFVATMGPLAQDPDIQNYVTDQTVAAITQKIDLNAVTKNTFDALANLGLPPQAASTLQTLAPAAANGLKGLLTDAVSGIVSSDAFAALWEQVLTVAHEQIVGVLSADSGSVLSAADNNTIGLQLGPVLEKLKPVLKDSGFPFADSIPTTDLTIPLTTVQNLDQIQSSYQMAVTLGIVLPLASLILLALGVVIARSRSRALVGASVALFVAMLVVVVAVAIGQGAFVNALSADVSGSVSGAIYNTIVSFVYSAAWALAILAVILGVTGYVFGPSPSARSLRTRIEHTANSVRESWYVEGPLPRGLGAFFYRWHVLIRAVIILAAVAVLVFWRPLTPLLVIVTTVLTLALLAFAVFFEAPRAMRGEKSDARPAGSSGSNRTVGQ